MKISDIQGRNKAALTLKPWRRRKLLGGHCECFEKQAIGFVIIGHHTQMVNNLTVEYQNHISIITNNVFGNRNTINMI
jgi:hypothetical protein